MDPLLPLSFSVHSSPGVYALLLGSGVSRAAGIPTGWEVTEDLITKLAAMVGEVEETAVDPAVWFRTKYAEEPDYSRVVDHLSSTPAERRRLLESYFEPTEEEREEGKKLPTSAHHAIARLAEKGYAKVILTTNFDKLMERALEAAGVTPTVISTPDAAEGAEPLQHTRCTVVKVNGDYLDARIKNTPSELAEYDPRMYALLDKVFGEYGLIVCGWSGEYDMALREAFKRSLNRRYGTYWAHRGELAETTKELVGSARGQLVEIESADDFFGELLEKVEALEDYGGHHPLSAPMAVATAKRYLAEDRHRIRLEELVRGETEHLYEALFSTDAFPLGAATVMTETGFRNRVESYRRLTEVLLAVMITGCYWDDRGRTLWAGSLERVANAPGSEGGYTILIQMQRYPALLLLYGGGIAAIAGERHNILANLLYRPKVRELSDEKPLALGLSPTAFYEAASWMSDYLQLDIPSENRRRYYFPFSEHLHKTLRAPLREIIPDDAAYDSYFDRFEYLFGVVYVDQRKQHRPNYSGKVGYGPIGRFGTRLYYPEGRRILEAIASEAESLGERWPLLQGGLFGGSFGRYRQAKEAYDSYVSEEPWERY